MFLDHDMRSVPPRWEPPRKPDHARRNSNIATTLIILVSAIALGAPIAGGTLVGVVMTLLRQW